MTSPDEQLKAEVSRLRGQVDSLTKALQLYMATAAATETAVQALLNAAQVDPHLSKPLLALLQLSVSMRREEPGYTELYRNHFENSIKSLLPDYLKGALTPQN